MILHTVAFRLHHGTGSPEETSFLLAAKKLRSLPGVLDFKVMRQVGNKNDFTFGLTMYFSSQQSYDAYISNPEHGDFLQNVWLPQVAEFMEIDYVEALI